MSEVIDELKLLRDGAEAIHKRLTALEVRTGATGVANKLVSKLNSTIRAYERGHAPWSDDERLAINAWRIFIGAIVTNGVVPSFEGWESVTEEEKEKWRQAALNFKAGETRE